MTTVDALHGMAQSLRALAHGDGDSTMPTQHKLLLELALVVVVYAGFSFYNALVVPAIGLLVRSRIPERARPLQTLTAKDKLYIAIAKISTAAFVYHVYRFVVATHISRMSVSFTCTAALLRATCWLPLHLAVLFVAYDFFYTLFHWALHWPPLYPLIHKHHHRQMSPFRGNSDAINDNPIEYVAGEYLHLLALFLLTRMAPTGQVHALTAIVFIFLGGTLASVNHTRINLHIPYMFNVNAHDYHHRQPRVNFGQYIMLWDWVFGTYQAEGTLPRDRLAAAAATTTTTTTKQAAAAAAARVYKKTDADSSSSVSSSVSSNGVSGCGDDAMRTTKATTATRKSNGNGATVTATAASKSVRG